MHDKHVIKGLPGTCGLYAIVAVTGHSYRKVLETAEKIGSYSRKGGGMNYYKVIRVLDKFGFHTELDKNARPEWAGTYKFAPGASTLKQHYFGTYEKDTRPTLSAFAKDNPKGRFILCVNNHYVVCIDGQIRDNGRAKSKKGRRRVKAVIEVWKAS